MFQNETSPTQSMFAKYLRPDRFSTAPSAENSDLKWVHWKDLFNNFLKAEIKSGSSDMLKLMLLKNHVDENVFALIRDEKSYDSAIQLLDNAYLRQQNEIRARHILATQKQRNGESLAEYLKALKHLSRDCNFRAVTAEEYKNEFIRDSFIAGLLSHKIRQKLLEKPNLTLQEVENLATSLETDDKKHETQTYQDNPCPSKIKTDFEEIPRCIPSTRADPLSLLRQYNINKEEIIERDNQIIFGELSWPKNVKTNYIAFMKKGSGNIVTKNEYYTLECCLYFLKNLHLVHPEYVRQAADNNIQAVRRPDRKTLLAYLNGEIATCASIDKKSPSEKPTQVKHTHDDYGGEYEAKKPCIEEIGVPHY